MNPWYTRRGRLLFRAVVAALAVAICSAGVEAQEESIKPGINERFKADDLSAEFWVKTFETESRAIFKHREAIVDALGLRPGMAVADVGAGTGFFTALIATRVADSGRVYAVDIAKNFLEHIRTTAKEAGISNITTVHCDDHSTKLDEESVDLVYVCDTYHHFEFPEDTLASIHAALRPGGQLVIVDFERVRGVQSEWALNHVRCGKGTVADEVRDAGFDFVEEVHLMEEQYVLKFKKRE